MNQSLQKLESTNCLCLQLKTSRQASIFQTFLGCLSIFSLLLVFHKVPQFMWLFLLIVFLAFTLFRKWVYLLRARRLNRVLQLHYYSNNMWAVKYKQGQHYFASQYIKPFICKWFCILYLRVPSSKRKITIIIHKDSIPTKKFQLLLYLLR